MRKIKSFVDDFIDKSTVKDPWKDTYTDWVNNRFGDGTCTMSRFQISKIVLGTSKPVTDRSLAKIIMTIKYMLLPVNSSYKFTSDPTDTDLWYMEDKIDRTITIENTNDPVILLTDTAWTTIPIKKGSQSSAVIQIPPTNPTTDSESFKNSFGVLEGNEEVEDISFDTSTDESSNKKDLVSHASVTAKITKINATDTSTESNNTKDENFIDQTKIIQQVEQMILDGCVNKVKNLENIVTWINSKTSKFEKGLTGILTNVYEDANAINDQIDSKIKTSMSNLESIRKDTENAKKLCQGLVNKNDKDIANIKKDLKKLKQKQSQV
jgi:hypothetical protein